MQIEIKEPQNNQPDKPYLSSGGPLRFTVSFEENDIVVGGFQTVAHTKGVTEGFEGLERKRHIDSSSKLQIMVLHLLFVSDICSSNRLFY